MRKIVIVASCESYRVADYLKAAAVLRLDPVVATDASVPVWSEAGHVAVDFSDPAGSAALVAATVPEASGVVAAEDETVEIAALVAQHLGLRHSLPEAVKATRDKLAMRRTLLDAGVGQPRFDAAEPGSVGRVAAGVGFPVVVKPVGLTASRGVIRVDNERDAVRAEARVRAILRDAGRDADGQLLVEEYVPGVEVVVEGLVVDGDLTVLAVIDKPDPLEGPFFEETLFVTPSRLSSRDQQVAVDAVAAAATALGLTTGPIHGEVRIAPDGTAFVLELAARTIGGLCARALSFDLLAESLEVIVLRSALGEPRGGERLARPAAGVLMLPIPASGLLTGVDGVAACEALPGVTEVAITIPVGRRVDALPEGDRYLGFVFASGLSPQAVEDTLRLAASTLEVTIDGEGLEADGIAALR